MVCLIILTFVTATCAPLLISWTTHSACPLCEAMRRRSESARTSATSCWLMKQEEGCSRCWRMRRWWRSFTLPNSWWVWVKAEESNSNLLPTRCRLHLFFLLAAGKTTGNRKKVSVCFTAAWQKGNKIGQTLLSTVPARPVQEIFSQRKKQKIFLLTLITFI